MVANCAQIGVSNSVVDAVEGVTFSLSLLEDWTERSLLDRFSRLNTAARFPEDFDLFVAARLSLRGTLAVIGRDLLRFCGEDLADGKFSCRSVKAVGTCMLFVEVLTLVFRTSVMLCGRSEADGRSLVETKERRIFVFVDTLRLVDGRSTLAVSMAHVPPLPETKQGRHTGL